MEEVGGFEDGVWRAYWGVGHAVNGYAGLDGRRGEWWGGWRGRFEEEGVEGRGGEDLEERS